MKLVIFGASGKVGSILVTEAVKRGHAVTAAVRSPETYAAAPGVRVIGADVYDTDAVYRAISGHQAILSTLGSWGTPQKTVVSAGARAIIQAMEKQHINRVVSLTGSDAWLPHETYGIPTRLFHRVLSVVAGKILRDGEEHLRLLTASNLDWTCVRSPIMNNRGAAVSYRLSGVKPGPTATINRTSVALAMLDCVGSDTFIKQAPFIRRA